MENLQKFPGEAPYISPEKQIEIYKAVKEDSVLPNHIQAKGTAKKPSDFRKILLTGVTGHLGPYLLQQLSQQNGLTHIFCLVRAQSIENAKERVVNKLEQTSLLQTTNLTKVFYVMGDVAQNKLGLDSSTYDVLANIIDAVVHNAVYSNHVKSYPNVSGCNSAKCQFRAVNVTGVKNVLEFVVAGVTKHILHGSSFSCVNRLDPVDGRLLEELPDENNLGDGIAWGYAYSKFVGEKLFKTALERGIPVTIVRYPTICGDSKTGFTSEIDNLTVVILSFWSSGLFPFDNLGMCVCPVDICALIAVKLFLNINAPTGVYNLSLLTSFVMEDAYAIARKNGVSPIRMSTYEDYNKFINTYDDKSNKLLTAFQKIYSKDHGLKEFFHSCPAMRLAWYDPQKVSGKSKKIEKYIPRYEDFLTTPQQCLQNMIDFFKNSKYFPHLGININPHLTPVNLRSSL